MSMVSVTFVLAVRSSRMNRTGWFALTSLNTVVAVVMANVVATTVAGVAESAYSSGNQALSSLLPWIA